MAEEVKQTEQTQQPEEKKSAGETVKMVLKIALGVVLVGLGIWAIIAWWRDLLLVIKGCIGLFLILAGAITIAIAKD
ncbi:MAG: hypothetical protein DRP61_05820 [Candidatus Omnitrophota bacterium]|nr:MAG: hypothetical protein DRP61_05820 [Candidatus Omnitrophota bacterium]